MDSAPAPRDLSGYWLHDLDPILLDLGPVEVRWYGVCFFLMLFTGYMLWRGQMLRGGHDAEMVGRILPYGVLGVVLGGRLVHCLFYEPDYYLANPLAMLDLRRSGLASHGSVLGLFFGLVLYCWRHGLSLLEIMDRFAYALMPAGAFVRLGNFLNSGIVGSESDVPWAVGFERFAAKSQRIWEAGHGPLDWTARPLPRHPVQLYEGAGMLAIFGVVWALDRRLGERRPRGLVLGLVLALYFAFRIAIERFKEFQRFIERVPDPVEHVIHVVPTAGVTMGQWLSIAPLALGLALVAWALRTRRPLGVGSGSETGTETGPGTGRSKGSEAAPARTAGSRKGAKADRKRSKSGRGGSRLR